AGRPFLLGSDLPGAVDRVRFTPTHLDIDDSYKLWTMLSQTPFALSLTYQASVVAIDGTNVPAAGKPVLQRTVRAVPGGRPAVAVVRRRGVVSATPDASGPAVEVQLDVPVADRARVRLLLDELDVPAGATARGYEFDAPFPLTGRADPHTVRVAVAGVVPGRYLVRVDADGAQNPLEQ